MSLKIRRLKTYIFLAMSVSFLLMGFSFTTPATANNGMPDRLLSGEFGQRINQFNCLFEDPCYNYISASESSYVIHGWNGETKEFGPGQPFTFQFFVDGHEVKLQRFAYQISNDPHVVAFYFYHVFDVGTFTVGTHYTEGLWTGSKGNEVYYSFGWLIVNS